MDHAGENGLALRRTHMVFDDRAHAAECILHARTIRPPRPPGQATRSGIALGLRGMGKNSRRSGAAAAAASPTSGSMPRRDAAVDQAGSIDDDDGIWGRLHGGGGA